MKRDLTTIIAVVALLLSIVGAAAGFSAAASLAAAGTRAPELVSYQGRVTLDGAPFSGTGSFKFAVIDGAGENTFWSNDGTSSAGSQPAAAVQLAVTDGTFSVLLGKAPMPPLGAGVFSAPDRALRVWFSPDGSTFSLLAPDRAFASVPFALQAEQAGDADTLDGQHAAYYQRRVNDTCPHGYAVLEVLEDGTVTCEPVEARPGFAITTLDSQGWEGNYSSIAIGADGLGLIAYRSDDAFDLKVAHCENLACTSATISTIVSAGDVGIRPSLVIGPDGLGLISFYDNSGTCALKVAHCNNLACTSVTVNTVDTIYTGRYSSLVIGADGLPLISYPQEAEENSKLRVAHCNDLLCSSATITRLDPTDSVGRYAAITIGSDGLGLIVYHENNNNHLRVAHCEDLACTSATIATLDTGGWNISVTVGADGLGLISYTAAFGNNLNVAHCVDRACSSATITTLGPAWPHMTSISVGPDGLGLIGYVAASGLRVAHCDNPACSSASISTIDDSGYMDSVSIAVGADGLALISYMDEDLGDLKVAHLSNPLGTPWTQR